MERLETDSRKSIAIVLSKLKSLLIGIPPRPEKIYYSGFVVGAIGIVMSVLIGKTVPGHKEQLLYFFALLGCFLWIYAFLIEAVTVVPKILRNTIFLALLGIVSILVLKATNIWIGRVINELTGADPDELPDASAALLVVFVPIAWIYVASALTIVSLLVMLTAGTIWTMLFHSKEQAVSFFARIAVVALFMTVTVAFGDYLREKSNSVALFIIVAAEYFEDRRCRNLEAEDLVAHLSEDNISIFSHRLNAFRFDICRN